MVHGQPPVVLFSELCMIEEIHVNIIFSVVSYSVQVCMIMIREDLWCITGRKESIEHGRCTGVYTLLLIVH